MHIKIIYIGRFRERTYDKKFRKYLEWISKDAKLEVITLKDSHLDRMINQVNNLKKNNHFIICLSERGKNFDSIKFSKFLFECGNKIAFILGNHLGLPLKLIEKSDFNLSLSKMTMPHEMANLFLIEQIYRAFSIKKGTHYHR